MLQILENDYQTDRAADALPLPIQLLWQRMGAIVEEQAQRIMRTAFCTIVRESGDLSSAIYDVEGRMLVQAETGTPGFIATMAQVARHLLARLPAGSMRPGDTFITNDPWLACGHLHDMTLLTPVFRGGRVIALIGSAAHVVDVGGRGLGPDAASIYEEGLCIPPMRLDDVVLELIRANVRDADKVIGDIHALAAANLRAADDLLAALNALGVADFGQATASIIDATRAAMRTALSRAPHGTWRNAVTIDGYDRPLTLAAALTIDASGATLDLAGSSPALARGINVPLVYTHSYAWFAIRCAVSPDVPANAGSFESLRVVAPEGSVVSAGRPWPVAARHIIGHIVPDLVLGCLDQALQGGCAAESAASLWGPQFQGGGAFAASDNAAEFTAITVHSGGCGARPAGDGMSATAFPTNLRVVPVEIVEVSAPLRILRRELRCDSGGAGRHRGGLGQTIEVAEAEGRGFAVNAMFERIDHPASGRRGGGPGAAGALRLRSGKTLRGKGRQMIPAGETLVLETPGGGGWGSPSERDPTRIAADVSSGLVSPRAAAEDYGAIIARDGGQT
jgi:N-methylhydantoinase B